MTAPAEVRSGVPAVREDANGNGAIATGDHQPASIQSLLELAIEKGAGVEALERLVALQERMEAREAAKEFARALSAFRANCPTIYKDKKITVTRRDGGSYSFMTAPLDRIAAVIDAPLAAEGLSYNWDRKMEGSLLVSVCTLRHLNGHTATSAFPCPTSSNNPGMSDQQKFAGAATFADRKSLAAVLGIVTAEEEDAEATRAMDPTPINEDKAILLDDLVGETKTDLARFLKHFGIKALKDLPAAQYDEALAVLNEKKQRRAR